jgi:hypothetical protein
MFRCAAQHGIKSGGVDDQIRPLVKGFPIGAGDALADIVG